MVMRGEDDSLKLNKLSFVLIFALLLANTSVLAAVNDEIVATVNGQEITLAQFYQALEQEAGPFVLSQLIIKELVAQKQEALGVSVDPFDFQLLFASIVSQLGGEAGYMNYLYQLGMTDAEFREQLEFELTLSMLAYEETTVTPEQVIEFFSENKDYFDQLELVRASHILVTTEAEADQLLALLEQGADFAELAQEHSLDTGNKDFGGDLGYFPKGTMVPEFETLAWSLDINSYDKVETTYGWHVVLVTDKLEAQPADLDAQWDYVEQVLIEYLSNDLSAYLRKLEEEAEIVILREGYQ